LGNDAEQNVLKPRSLPMIKRKLYLSISTQILLETNQLCNNSRKQAGAELCQAQFTLGLAEQALPN
jgi:hypothetical protein